MPQTDPHVSSDLCALGIADLVDLIARREVSPVEMAHASLARYEATEPYLNAFISIDRNLVIADAVRLETEARRGEFRGPLHGVPFGLKDLFAVRGTNTTWGASPYKDQIVDVDATGRDVGGDQHGRRPVGKLGEIAGARVLRQIAVQFNRGYAA